MYVPDMSVVRFVRVSVPFERSAKVERSTLKAAASWLASLCSNGTTGPAQTTGRLVISKGSCLFGPCL